VTTLSVQAAGGSGGKSTQIRCHPLSNIYILQFLLQESTYSVRYQLCIPVLVLLLVGWGVSGPKNLMPNTHRRRRRDETFKLRCVSGVNTPVSSRDQFTISCADKC